MNLYFLCSSPGVGVVIKLVYSLVALEQVFHCDKLIQISTNLGYIDLGVANTIKFHYGSHKKAKT